jgi:REP element-mobilizing transposase RayT
MKGMTLHVTQRGNNRTTTFREPFDYEIFLLFIRLMIGRYDVQVHAYALMGNHFHLMVTPESPAALSRAMQSLGRRYVRYFNDRYQRTGTLHAFGAADPLVAAHPVYDALASTPDRRQEAWRHMCGTPVQTEQLEILRKSIATGVVIGALSSAPAGDLT